MAKQKKIALVTEEGGTFTFRCPHAAGCGANGVPWSSGNWPTKQLAAARGRQHLREHETGADPTVDTEVTPPLDVFYRENGLVDANAVTPPNPDDWEI